MKRCWFCIHAIENFSTAPDRLTELGCVILAILHFDGPAVSGDLMTFRTFAGLSLYRAVSNMFGKQTVSTHTLHWLSDLPFENMYNPMTAWRMPRIGVFLCRTFMPLGDSSRSNSAGINEYLCLSIDALLTTKGRLVPLLLGTSGAIDFGRGQSTFRAYACMTAVALLGRINNGRVRPGMSSREHHIRRYDSGRGRPETRRKLKPERSLA